MQTSRRSGQLYTKLDRLESRLQGWGIRLERNTRVWMETLDHAGRVRIVRLETGGPKIHYLFDELGNLTGTF